MPTVGEGWGPAEHLGTQDAGKGGQDSRHPISVGFWEVWGSWSRGMGWGISCCYPAGLLGLTGKLEEWESPWHPKIKGGAEGTFGNVGDWPWGGHAVPGWCWGWKGGGGGWQEREEGDPLSQGDPSWATARPSLGSNPVTSSHVEPRSRARAHSQEPGTAMGVGWDPVLGSEEMAWRRIPIVFLNTLIL